VLKLLAIFGTRPEAIKMAPVIHRLKAERGVHVDVCVTGQHNEMLKPVLDLFGIVPDDALTVMTPGQTLNDLFARVIRSLDPVLVRRKPDRVLVHGDTTSALAASIAAFHHRIPVGHVEAGLRTHDLAQPWPEEMNRRSIDGMADLLLAPTPLARDNLLADGLGGRRIVVTGNTVIDALLMTRARLQGDAPAARRFAEHFPFCCDPARRFLLVTGHRRENFGAGFAAICDALDRLAVRGDLDIVYPLHLNPNVREPVMSRLGDHPRIRLIAPLDYASFVAMMDRAHVVLTDSGGVQEEAPSLGKPVLVMREVTERPEAVAAGTARLVGTAADAIVNAVAELFDDPAAYAAIARAVNPYGDGKAAERIADALLGRAVEAFCPALPIR
jgi:UDP-N-acetylglucosamine 2-epimerase (non-hydrolysing)